MANNGQGQNTADFNLAALQQQAPYKGLLRAEQINPAGFPFLSAGELASYPAGVANLWRAIASRPADDAQHVQALSKLRQLTATVLKKYNDYKAKLAAERLAANASQTQDGARPPSQGQPQAQLQTQPHVQPQNQQTSQTPLVTQNQSQNPAPPQLISQVQVQPQQRNPPQNSHLLAAQQAQQTQQQELLTSYKQQADMIPWEASINLHGPEAEHWRQEAKRRYTEALGRQADATREISKLEGLIQATQARGGEVPPAAFEARDKQQQKHAESKKFLETIMAQQRINTADHQAARLAGKVRNVQSTPQPTAQQTSNGMQNRPSSSHNLPQGPTHTSLDATRQQQQQQQGQPGSPAVTNQHQQQQQQLSQKSMAQMPQNTNTSHSQTQPTAFTATRPQPNPTQSAHFPQGQHQSPQSIMPGTNMVSGSTNAPAPLTAQAAIAASQRSYSSQPQGLQQSISGSGSTSRPDLDKSNSKQWPMNKSWIPTAPQPVTMAAARPTLTGANNGPMGVMGQPAIQKQPPFLLQGAGDRVLDKKKLDELVRQVTGGSGDGLHPDVEESVLQLADEFVDNVITSACKLAKLRGSTTLEVRDIQLVLERQYNIRVPGYATDEIRTVRKIQPAAGYLQKMSAVQAAKVMGGKTDI